MPKAYWVGAHMTIRDLDKLKAYAKLAAQASTEHGGRVLARGGAGAGKVMSLEGFDQSRVAVTEFPSMKAAVDCFHSQTYQTAMAKLDDGVERDIFIVEGLE
ncbi:MAG: DUF1330 domain-containing protein [Arenicellales bacterium]|nr:DUF1330 domain-containing protein [Arenicellales bacterium]